ncbi:MAG: hypothetical protein WCC11_06155 [Gammaproteobacteria bacterium]
MNKPTSPLALALALALAAPLGFAAGSADQELTTATIHAQMAGDAANLATATMHFHHVINCLVGSRDKRYDAKVGDPCTGMGNGVLNDLGHAPAEHIKLEHAVAMLEQALHADTVEAARQDAVRIAVALKQAASTQ